MRLDADAVDDLRGRVHHDVERGLIPAGQFALAIEGDVVVHDAVGTATTSDRLPMYSSGKVLSVAATWRLLGDGRLTVGTRAVDVLPWFTGNGLDDITVDHLLCHTAGISSAPLGPPEWFEVETRQKKMASWYTTTAPGEEFAYHATSAQWVLAEMIAAICATDHCAAIHALVTEPLGLPRMLGVDDRQVRVLGVEPVSGGSSHGEFVLPEISDETLLRFNDSDVRALGVPGGGAIATAADVTRLYQALLHNPDGLFDPDVLADGIGTIRVTDEDPLRLAAANRTRGLMVAGTDGLAPRRGMGVDAGPRTFGHDGAGGQVAWADPDTGLSFCFLTTGLDLDLVRQGRRGVAVSTRAQKCVVAD